MAHGLPLKLDELTLRRIGPVDASDLYEIYSRREVAQYEFWDPWTAEQVASHICSQAAIRVGDPGVALVLGVILEPDGRLIGECQITITSVDDRQAEIGFTFNPDYSGRGYASRAVNACLGFAFGSLGMHRVMAATDVRNVRSWRLMERLGMRREAHFVHDNFVKGQWVDDYVYAMLEDEWQLRNAITREHGR
jgi:RimJ/RimL family protein N-acetyltransferase